MPREKTRAFCVQFDRTKLTKSTLAETFQAYRKDPRPRSPEDFTKLNASTHNAYRFA